MFHLHTPATHQGSAKRKRSPAQSAAHSRGNSPSPDTTQKEADYSRSPDRPIQYIYQKRERESGFEDHDDDEPEEKRRRTESGTLIEWVQRVNEANLEGCSDQDPLEPPVPPEPSETSDISESFEEMAEKRRRLSRQSSVTDMNQDTASNISQKSSMSISNYRCIVLDRARIAFRHGDLPENIRGRVDGILLEIPEERNREVFSIADSLCKAFPPVLEDASREDDTVEKICHALETMGAETVILRRKADWNPNLKPKSIQRKSYRPDPPDTSVQDINDSLQRSNSQQQVQTSYISPERSETSMLPPPPKQDTVKTPRPDGTLGFHHIVVVEKLKTLGVGELDADCLLKDLEFEGTLYSNPILSALVIRFPSIVLEGKSYATGRSIYEAQNQAGVSGAGMLMVQEQLNDLAAHQCPNSAQPKEPLAFSICTEGPYMELWVHYVTLIQDTRFYNMNLLKICHASCPETVKEFLIAVESIMTWARSELLDHVAKQLSLVWKAAQQEAA